MNKKITRLFTGLFAALCLSTSVLAADIQVITSGAFAEALKALVPEYERQSPNKVIISYGSSFNNLKNILPIVLELT